MVKNQIFKKAYKLEFLYNNFTFNLRDYCAYLLEEKNCERIQGMKRHYLCMIIGFQERIKIVLPLHSR